MAENLDLFKIIYASLKITSLKAYGNIERVFLTIIIKVYN